MLNLVACDPNVAVVNIFHLIDESALEGWQSGLYFADQQPKQSAAAVASWISTTHGNCTGTQTPFLATGAASTTTSTSTTTTTTGSPSKTAPVPAGCTGTCARVLLNARTACTATSASKKGCNKAIASALAQLTALQKKALHAKGTRKKQLAAVIAAYKQALSTGKANVKTLKH